MVLSVYSSKAAAKNAIGYFRYVSSACWDFFRSRASRCAMDSFMEIIITREELINQT
jgi:hypothetical protein